MFTYIIEMSPDVVKIGHSRKPNNRIADFQITAPNPLRFLLLLEDNREKELHRRFAKDRIHNELFVYSARIESFIQEHLGNPPFSDFYIWFMSYTKCDDPTGDLARDAKGDKKFPRFINEFYARDESKWPNEVSLKHDYGYEVSEMERVCDHVRHRGGDHIVLRIMEDVYGEWMSL